jgi:hypothetical protein
MGTLEIKSNTKRSWIFGFKNYFNINIVDETPQLT